MGRTGKTAGKLSALKVAGAKRPGMINDGNGLYLKIDEGGSKSWILRFKVRGRSRKYGLGPLHTVGLALAREKAADARRLLLDGRDPIEERRKVKAAALLEAATSITFDECAEAYIETNKAGWRNPKHTREWGNTVKRYASPVFGHLAVADVDVGLVVRALEGIWTTIPETASRVRGRIETVLDYAKARGYRTGENPASMRGNLAHILPAHTPAMKSVRQHPALAYAEAPALMAVLRKRDEIAAQALMFTILTAGRTGEVVGARWDEVDTEAKTWNIPGDRMKSGKPHMVPLSPGAIAILARMREIGRQHGSVEYVFPSEVKRGKSMTESSPRLMLRRLGRHDIAVHGFRSSFRDWAAEHGYPDAVAEAALAHAVSDKVVASYKRTTFDAQRRVMMDAWSTFLSAPPEDARRVIPMRRKAKAGA